VTLGFEPIEMVIVGKVEVGGFEPKKNLISKK
jgi:hypothetical protein